jgi:basic membrane lipoprotein Med (substrate-binding protein (PBP1-ABC) superfamily)
MILKLLAGAALAVAAISASGAAEAKGTDKAILLVHGGFVDGSGWEGVYKVLKKDGYDVTVVQNSTISLKADVATTKAAIKAQTKPVILVGHSTPRFRGALRP